MKPPRPGETPELRVGSLQDLPSVDKLLRQPGLESLVNQHGHSLVVAAARRVLDDLRSDLTKNSSFSTAIDAGAISKTVSDQVLVRLEPRMKAVLNLSGTVIHTNLGRAVLSEQALQHVAAMMAGPNNLEFDLASGARGDRDDLVEELLCTLTGSEAATVVNNNAAAVLLTVAALARGGEVVVSRGELVEIGGAFRMPDVIGSAGATLVEVGTTNRTHPNDYERAINPRTTLVLKVHTSNYVVQGFTAAVDEAILAPIAHAHSLPLASDLGSGSLLDLTAYGLPREVTPQEKLRAGCDVVSFSGDKLLGGPQAGLIVGSKEAISRIRKFPLKRALRISKLPLAALEATLLQYLQPEKLVRDLPTLRLLTRPALAIRTMAEALLPSVVKAVGTPFSVSVVELQSQIGSGSLPVERLASAGLAIRPLQKKSAGRLLEELAAAWRGLPLPVVGRISENSFVLDMRCLEDATLFTSQLPRLEEACLRFSLS